MKNSSNPLIFIVDHSTGYRKILKSCLEALNYKNILTFSNSEEMHLLKLSPDIIILDQELGLNQMKGLEFIKKHKSAYIDTHFIFLSSVTNIEVAVDCIKFGAFDYIIKSKIGLERLILKIDGLLTNQIKQKSRKKIYNTAVVTLGMLSLILIVAVILYNNQII